VPEDLAFVDVGHVDLDGGEGDGLQRVENGDAGVGVGGGVDHDAVKASVGGLNRVDDRAFVVGLHALRLDALLYAYFLDVFEQRRIILPAVYIRLAHTEHIDIRAVDHKQFHIITSCIFFAVRSMPSSA